MFSVDVGPKGRKGGLFGAILGFLIGGPIGMIVMGIQGTLVGMVMDWRTKGAQQNMQLAKQLSRPAPGDQGNRAEPSPLGNALGQPAVPGPRADAPRSKEEEEKARAKALAEEQALARLQNQAPPDPRAAG
jgi:hypothetical protein